MNQSGRMLIAVAGPYSAATAEARQRNLDAMNAAAAQMFRLGHIPVIGVNAALPVVDQLDPAERYENIMAISLAVVEKCDAILMIGESPGANRERDLMQQLGRPVYTSLSEVPILKRPFVDQRTLKATAPLHRQETARGNLRLQIAPVVSSL